MAPYLTSSLPFDVEKDFAPIGIHLALPHIRSGKIRAIAIGERERLPTMRDLPTIGESLSGYEAGFWFGLMVRAGTPETIVGRISREIAEIVALPDIAERLKKVGFEVNPGNAAQMRATMKSDMQKWAKVVKDAGIKPLD